MNLRYQLLSEAGRVVPPNSERISQLLAVMTPKDVAVFLDLVAFHRVAPQVHLNISRSESRSPAATAILQCIAGAAENSETYLNRHQEKLAGLVADSGVALTAIKGLAITHYYSNETGCRHVGDADILVSLQDTWRLLEYLALNGYSFRKIRFGSYHAYLSDDRYPPYYGVCPAKKEFPDGKFRLDVHFGAFPACGYGLVGFSQSDTVEHSGGIRWPTTQKSLLINLAHVIRQGFCRFRDINDVYLLTRALHDGEAAAALAEVRSSHLLPVLRSMLRMICSVYETDLPSPWSAEAPGATRWADRELLFGRRRLAERYADGVRVVWSRIWQMRYLTALSVELFGPAAGSLRAVGGAALLFRTGRPYRMWSTERDIDADERFVIRPVSTFQRSIDEPSVLGRLRAAGWLAKRNTRLDFWQVRAPAGAEFILSGRMVCVQTDYSGARRQPPSIEGPIRELARIADVDVRFLP